jgi:putative methyltransferase (TIGR04325 family)
MAAPKGAGMTALAWTLDAARAAKARLAVLRGKAPRFSGAYRDREAALAALPPEGRRGYDTDGIAEVSFEAMCKVAPWDYPLIYWLGRLAPPGGRIVDAGGHMGTKHIAFSPYLPLRDWSWTVLDLPAIVDAARMRQANGQLPAEIGFATEPGQTPKADILLASGLLQYLDVSLTDYLQALPALPRHILLNKVAMHDSGPLVTLERIGPAFVPYAMRDRITFEAELAALGYAIRDVWEIPDLAHWIPTHPGLGTSRSYGYCLERKAAA